MSAISNQWNGKHTHQFREYCCIMYPKCLYSESILSFKNFPFLPEKLMGLGMRLNSSYRGRSEVTLINSTVRAATAASQWSMLKPTYQVQSAVVVTQKYQ